MHFGSLVAALASFLDARANQGTWLLRMEDLDPEREPPGAADRILDQLTAFGLNWDGDVVYQSHRLEAYRHALDALQGLGCCFACDCSRQRIQAMGNVYDGHCRRRRDVPPADHALRVRVDPVILRFTDLIQGEQEQDLAIQIGDFVIRRRDGLFAYQLAVVVDDAWQGVTRVVRGHDLLDSTARQIYLQGLLGLPTPEYAHIPVIVDEGGHKLSKQQMASAADPAQASLYLHQALIALGHEAPPGMSRASTATLLDWAISNWHIQKVPKLASIPESASFTG